MVPRKGPSPFSIFRRFFRSKKVAGHTGEGRGHSCNYIFIMVPEPALVALKNLLFKSRNTWIPFK
jgi:hypothetical protein